MLGSGEVTLRRWRERDAQALYELVQESLEHLRPWSPWVADGYPPEAAKDFLAGADYEWEQGASFNYAVYVSGTLAGSSAMMARIGPGGYEIGYWLHPAFTGRGVATRAASLLVAEAFREGAHRVEIVTDVANFRSAAIPQRLGFTEVARRPPQEPLTPGEDGLDIVWRLRP